MDEARADEYYIAHLAVLPAFRGRGIGAALLEDAARQAKAAGLNKCSLTVDIDNLTAQRLYVKTGFREVRRRHQPEMKKKFATAGYLRMVRELG
jgi:ribosomal protein S18 acetylase RimI-like enzyme